MLEAISAFTVEVRFASGSIAASSSTDFINSMTSEGRTIKHPASDRSGAG
jgi:hypothetical protein